MCSDFRKPPFQYLENTEFIEERKKKIFLLFFLLIVKLFCYSPIMYKLYKKVSTQNERFLCKMTHVHALITIFTTLFSNSTTSIHHNPDTNHSSPEPADLPGQLRLPLAAVQQECHQGRNTRKLETCHRN